jgi:hypothetical protein
MNDPGYSFTIKILTKLSISWLDRNPFITGLGGKGGKRGGGNEGIPKIRLANLKRRVFDLAGTKNSSWTDRPRKSGRFEIKRF